jgi:hypothetical protein
MGAIMKRIAKQPPARAHASMAEMCYKHYEISVSKRNMVDASRWLLKAHTYREKAGQIGHDKELENANQ